jgi:hypothetical protein
MTPVTLTHALGDLIDVARIEFGETEWLYFKKDVRWSQRGRRSGSHFIAIGDGTPVTREEYEAGVAEGKRCQFEAFMGRYPRSYVLYEKKIAKSGWREELIKILETAT